MKKILSIIIAFAMIATISVMPAYAADSEQEVTLNLETSYTPKAPEGFSDNPLNALMYGDGEEDKVTVYSSIIVNVSSPCDEEWRAKYPNNWMWQANRAIEDADEMMRTRFNIDLRSISQKYWDSNDSADPNGSSLLDEAWNEWGLSGADLMIAFSAQRSNWGGWGYVLGSGCLIFDQGYEANCSVVRHEVGHNYGCDDHYDDATPYPYACVMNDSYNQYNSLCPTCNSTWSANRYLH